MQQFRTVVLGWSFGLILLSCARHDTMPQVFPVLMNPWFYLVGFGRSETLP